MVSQASQSGQPRDDLAAAQLGIEPIPDRHRVLGFRDIFVLWADLGVGLLVLLAGALLVPGLGFWPAMIAIVAGTVIGNVLLGLAGVIGSAHAVPSMVALRPSFGLRGSYLPSAVNVVQLVGFGAFEVIVMAQASARLAAPVLGQGTYPLWAIAWTAVAVLMGVAGPLVVVRQWLEKVGIWVVLGTAAWIFIYVMSHYDLGAALARPGDGSLTFAQAIDLVVVMPVSWLPLAADYNRFARDARASFWGTFWGYAVANVTFYALGVLLVLVLPGSDLIGSILSIAFGTAGLALLLGDEADNAFADIYSTAISLKNVRPGWSTRGLVVAVGGIVLAIALTIDITRYQGFLFLVGSLITPLFGVLFADYFVIRRRAYGPRDLYPSDTPGGDGDRIGLPAIGAWLAGICGYLLVTNLVPWLGGTLPALGLSFAAHLGLTWLDRDRARRRASAS